MKAFLFLAICGGLAIATSPAEAAVTFNLRHPTFRSGTSLTETATNADLDVVLEASATGSGSAPRVNQSALGTGVFAPGVDPSILGGLHPVDGRSRVETLKMTFELPFRIDSLCLSFIDRNDDIRIKAGDTVLNLTNFNTSFLDLSGRLPFAEVVELTAPNAQSEWFVTSLKGEVIPEPSTALIWSALGVGVVVWRRRRRKLSLA